MRRVGHLWERVIDGLNLRLAFYRAARGKRDRVAVGGFAADLDVRLDRMRQQLVEGSFHLGNYHQFEVFDPKRRTIHAAVFQERVFHHALMGVCEPVFERRLIHHTYACRKNKGRLKALEIAKTNTMRNKWYLKLDIRKYFESIHHAYLKAQIARIIKDRMVLEWFGRVIDSHASSPGRGLPIGSLTSQHLANLYLSPLDRYCQSLPEISGYVRYMDDFVLWSDDKGALLEAREQVVDFINKHLSLELKAFTSPQRCAYGIGFLGFRVYADRYVLAQRSRNRYRKKLGTLNKLFLDGTIGEAELQRRLSALTAFVLDARSWQCRQRLLTDFGTTAVGFEPCDSGRQLEQQREQLSRGEPQQQRAIQPQQQHWLPPCPQLRPRPLNGVIQHLEDLTRWLSRTLSLEGKYKPCAGCIGRYLDGYATIQPGTLL